MILGIQQMVVGTTAKSYYTPWFPKAADNAYFTWEIVHQNFGSGGGITVTAYTKNPEDVGSEGEVTSFPINVQIGSSGFYEKKCENLRRLVRFKITITPGTSPSGPEGVCFRILAPTWYDTAV